MKLTESKKIELLEKLAKLEHQQWMLWATHVLETENISIETRNRWESDFIPYGDLPESIKKLDRPFANKSLDVFEKYLKNL